MAGDKPASLKGNLELRDLSFAYPQRREVPVFTQLNLQVQAGTTVALVGPSGGGKSTIVSLVQRFYDPTAGQVCAAAAVSCEAYEQACCFWRHILCMTYMHVGCVDDTKSWLPL